MLPGAADAEDQGDRAQTLVLKLTPARLRALFAYWLLGWVVPEKETKLRKRGTKVLRIKLGEVWLSVPCNTCYVVGRRPSDSRSKRGSAP